MEKNFYTDDFEQFLKDTVEDFRMYPTRRVWRSIYNNIHPDRKWPSLAVSVLLLFSLIFVSISNNKVVTRQPGNSVRLLSNQSAINKENLPSTSSVSNGQESTSIQNEQTDILQPEIDPSTNIAGNQNNRISANNTQSTTEQPDAGFTAGLLAKNSMTRAGSTNMNTAGVDQQDDVLANNPEQTDFNQSVILKSQFNSYTPISVADLAKTGSSIKKPLVKKRTVTYHTDKEWIEGYAFENKPVAKWKGRLSYQLYATPSVGYRSMAKNTDVFIPQSSLIPSSNNSNTQDGFPLTHLPGLNLEAGGTFLYNFTKALRVKAGLQLNYTSYKIQGFEMNHPAFTTLMLNNSVTGQPELVSRVSTIANVSENTDADKFNSSTYQVSLPIGADFKIAGKDKIQWFAGATIQPSFVVGGNGFLISSDQKNYVYDHSMMRRWNVNAGVETFISYRLNNGVVFNAGPQLRYQLLSTYSERYTYDEKLYNIGVKLGVTRNF